jgi:hypothetical protein
MRLLPRCSPVSLLTGWQRATAPLNPTQKLLHDKKQPAYIVNHQITKGL